MLENTNAAVQDQQFHFQIQVADNINCFVILKIKIVVKRTLNFTHLSQLQVLENTNAVVKDQLFHFQSSEVDNINCIVIIKIEIVV